jgi:hypothetical protein
MSTEPIVPQTPLQRLIVERALAYARQLEQAANSAPDGSVLGHCEKVALGQGREFLRLSVADALQAQADPLEKKAPPHARAAVGSPAGTKAAPRAGS